MPKQLSHERPSDSDGFWRTQKGRRTIWIGASALVLVIIAVIVLLVWQPWASPEPPPAPVQTPQEVTYQNDLQTGINTGVLSVRDIVVSAGPLTPSDRQRLANVVARQLTNTEDFSDAVNRPAVAAIVPDQAIQDRVLTSTYKDWGTYRILKFAAADARTALRNSIPGLNLSGPLPLSPAFRVNVGCESAGNEAAVMLDNTTMNDIVLANTTGQGMSDIMAGCTTVAPFFHAPRLN